MTSSFMRNGPHCRPAMTVGQPPRVRFLHCNVPNEFTVSMKSQKRGYAITNRTFDCSGAPMAELYKFLYPAWDITIEADRLRREKNELIGELTVRCGLP